MEWESGDGGPFLGPGLKVGFQELLHEVFQQRPKDEFGIDTVVMPPKGPVQDYLTFTERGSRGCRPAVFGNQRGSFEMAGAGEAVHSGGTGRRCECVPRIFV